MWPLARSTNPVVTLNKRRPEPEGKRIGFVCDHVFRGDEMYAIIGAELVER